MFRNSPSILLRLSSCSTCVAALFYLASVPAATGQQGDGPVVEHDPIKVVVRGQPVSLLAKVTSQKAAVKSVVLNYTLSRHGAPRKIEMQSTGMGLYNASVPASFIQRGKALYYYIEAEDVAGRWTETTWQAVSVQEPAGTQPSPAGTQPGVEDGEGKGWGTKALIAGGAVGIAVAAIVASDSGGGGGGGSSGGGGEEEEDISGTYSGQSIFCRQLNSGPISCDSGTTTIVIDGSGSIGSSDLAAGSSVSGVVNGDQFTMAVPASQVTPGAVGQITFSGTVRNGTISGTISGEAQSAAGTWVYSGTFNASQI